MSGRPQCYSDAETCVEDTLQRLGRRIVLGAPLGLGKANHLVNEFFRRAREDSRIDLRIFTALTLGRPRWTNDLERRLVEPLAERLFDGYPELDYVDAVRRGDLPDNIRVTEFYFQPGSLLRSPLAQRMYVSTNYTHVVRDLLDAGINVLAQLVGVDREDGETHYSLSCNSDLTLDLVPRLREAERRGQPVALLAQVNRELPFMYGDADVAPDYFHAVLDHPRYEFPLFGVPNRAVDAAEYFVALHVSGLVRDGGTIQIGIGSLGQAITYLLKLRHERNDLYRDVLDRAGVLERSDGVIERLGGTMPFERGLYASSEMLVDGFIELYRSGILKRKVYDDPGLQRSLNEGIDQEAPKGGHFAHACFLLGPRSFYEALRTMDRAEREQICMTGISYVNQLYGQEELKRLQRQHARFINTGLVVTLSGAVASDALEDGRVVSGVGGQYNFVTMAHALEDGRSILMIRATTQEEGGTASNVRWSYGHTTIPRHLRDVVVTEYGIADLRGRSDEEVATALIEIADARYQDELLEAAKGAGKVSENYRIPDRARANRPERLDEILAPYRERGFFDEFPFGTDLTREEVVLKRALTSLKRMLSGQELHLPGPDEIRKVVTIPQSARSYLERMGLDDPHGAKELLLQRAVVYALASIDAL
jgi:acyl-CoA hydrolase